MGIREICLSKWEDDQRITLNDAVVAHFLALIEQSNCINSHLQGITNGRTGLTSFDGDGHSCVGKG